MQGLTGIANEVKQSMHSDCMDCHAALAVTQAVFLVRVRYRARYDRLAMAVVVLVKPIRPI